MSSLHIVADENIYQAQHYLSSIAEVTLLSAAQINAASLKKADALFVRSKNQINQELLRNTPVKFVGSTVSGTDHIDFDYLQSNAIECSIAKGCNANSVALYCLLAVFELQQKNKQKVSLRNKTIGIVGYGKTAQKLIDKLCAFGANVRCYDPPYFKQQDQFLLERHISYVQICDSLVDIMHCDIISLHPSLHDHLPYKSYQLINKQLIAHLTEQQILINSSRGEIVDEQALLEHIKKEPFQLVIDCWQNEPYINEELLQYAQIATPHIAGHSIQAKLNGTQRCFNDLCQWKSIEQKHDSVELQKVSHSESREPIDLSVCNHSEEAFLLINQANYLPSFDSLGVHFQEFALEQRFSHYRKHYPIRHELLANDIKVHNTPEHLQNFINQIAKVL